jgi:hypothetical protein
MKFEGPCSRALFCWKKTIKKIKKKRVGGREGEGRREFYMWSTLLRII